MAELLGRKPLFPGKDYVDMLKKIVDKTGNPAVEDQDHVSEKVMIKASPLSPLIDALVCV